jgi:hypothetical protein
LRVFYQDCLMTEHKLRPAQEGWVRIPEHHAKLWAETMRVDHRPLAVYEEATWN